MTASDNPSARRQRLRDALKAREEQEYAAFLADPSDAGLAPAEIDEGVAKIMARFDELHAAAKPVAPPADTVPWSVTELIAALARELIERMAPDELVLFAMTRQAFFDNPEAVLHPAPNRAAGFGATDAPLALGPSALYVTRDVLQMLDAGPDSAAIKTALTQRLDASVDTPAPLALSAEALERVRAAALASAHKVGLPEPTTQQLTELIVARLADA